MKVGRHICTVCNNIYEEPDHATDCGCNVAFEALPADWKCPECGGEKEMYQPCACVTVGAAEVAECRVHENVGR